MRVLILSDRISHQQRLAGVKYQPAYDITVDVADLNDADGFKSSVFDYDVSIVHITKPWHHSIGYYQHLPKLLADAKVALENGRTIICLPGSEDFRSERLHERGMRSYEWLESFGMPLNANEGDNAKASQAGRSQVIQEYLSYAPKYYQIVKLENPLQSEILAVVDDTQIIVGISHAVLNGRLVILPPPKLDGDFYILSMARLLDVCRHFFDLMRRHIPVSDVPEWLDSFLVSDAKQIHENIEQLQLQKARFDLIAYALYGTGSELEESVKAILEDLGLEVDRQPPGANIDLRARHPPSGIEFAFEVTGTTGIVRKESNKVSQCWQHISDRASTPQEGDRLVVLANTECHLNPASRRPEGFSQDVAKLLAPNGVLLLTAVQLYDLWKDVHEGKRMPEDVVNELFNSHGLYLT